MQHVIISVETDDILSVLKHKCLRWYRHLSTMLDICSIEDVVRWLCEWKQIVEYLSDVGDRVDDGVLTQNEMTGWKG